MRRGLWLTLLASTAAAVWVVLTPEQAAAPTAIVAASEPTLASSRQVSKNGPLPARWEAPALEPARRNPFGPEATAPAARPAAASTPPPKPMVAQPAVAPTPTATVTAPFGYRYVGRMIDPQGLRIVYVGRGDQVLTVQVGTQLADGYVVESMSESTIEVVHTPTMQHQTIAIPPDATATAANGGTN